MKLQRATILVFVTLAAAIATYSQPFAGAKVAMINTEAFSDEKSGITKLVNADKALDVEFKPKQDELNAMKTRYDNLAKEVQQLQDKLSSPPKGVPFDENATRVALNNKVDEGQRLEIEIKRKAEDAKAQYEKRSKVVIGPISADIGKAMNVFAKTHGIDMILDTSKLGGAGVILYMNAAADVTEAFIKDYNLKNAGVPVKN